MWLLKSPFDQNSIMINHKFNYDFNSHIILSRIQVDKSKPSKFTRVQVVAISDY
jgi:hypothetical protein